MSRAEQERRTDRRASLWRELFETDINKRAGIWHRMEDEYGLGDFEVLQAFADAFEGAAQVCGVASRTRLDGNPNAAESSPPGSMMRERRGILKALRRIQHGQGPTATGLVAGTKVKLPASAFEVTPGRPSLLDDKLLDTLAGWREAGWLDGPSAMYARLESECAVSRRTAREWSRVGLEHITTGNTGSRYARFRVLLHGQDAA